MKSQSCRSELKRFNEAAIIRPRKPAMVGFEEKLPYMLQ